MSTDAQRDIDTIPGTFVFDGRRARIGYPLNNMCMSLNDEKNRRRFVEDTECYLAGYGLTDAQRDAVLSRDWLRMLELGGNIYFLFKIAMIDGLNIQEVGAQMSGVTYEQFVDMMAQGGRGPRG